MVLDDFLITPAGQGACRDLLEVVEDRSQLRSTIVVRQLPPEKWHGAMSDPTLAEAVLDRLPQSSHRIAMKGQSMRKRQPPTDTEEPWPHRDRQSHCRSEGGGRRRRARGTLNDRHRRPRECPESTGTRVRFRPEWVSAIAVMREVAGRQQLPRLAARPATPVLRRQGHPLTGAYYCACNRSLARRASWRGRRHYSVVRPSSAGHLAEPLEASHPAGGFENGHMLSPDRFRVAGDRFYGLQRSANFAGGQPALRNMQLK